MPLNIISEDEFNFLINSGIFPDELVTELKTAMTSNTSEDNSKPEDNTPPVTDINFNFDMVNTNKNLKELVSKLKNSKYKAYSLLLYGEPGCGKSYFGKFLAQELGMPVIKKRASDLIDKFVGATERNIAKVFQEAKEKNAILIFDEADSFLISRKTAKQEYTVGQVNEMLTQMEDHQLPFICTTNLKENLDNASFRRFIFKVKYDFMTEDNIKAGIKDYFNQDVSIEDIKEKELQHITAGDFVVVKKKLDILEDSNYSKDHILEYLKEEQEEKGIKITRKIGW